jgi:hypothetical protein
LTTVNVKADALALNLKVSRQQLGIFQSPFNHHTPSRFLKR